MIQYLYLLSNLDFHSKLGASYSRVLNYSSAINSNINVTLSSKLNILNSDYKLFNTKFDRVKIIGIPKTRHKKLINDIYLENLYFFSYFRYIKRLYKYTKTKGGNRSFLLYPGNLALMIICLFYLKLIKGEKVFIEKNELMTGIAWNIPVYPKSLKFISFLFIKLFLLIIYFIQDILTPFFTGIIVISTKLEKLYKPFNKNIIRIPILCEEYKLYEKNQKNNIFKIGYAGDINQNKDGICSFIKTLGKLKEESMFNFFIWGAAGSKTSFSKIRKLIAKLELENYIYFKGSLNSDKLRSSISMVDLLVLPRPSNLQTEYGFSTKLGEYLMSGIPVLVTNVSDNPLYIKDGKNGFIVKSNDKQIMFNKIREIMNYSKGALHEIGIKGRQTAEEYFISNHYVNILSSFLFSDKQSR